jgi:hypothetical protein
MFDRFTKAFAFANFYHAFKALFGEEAAPACGNKLCRGLAGPPECPASCHCQNSTGTCVSD